MTLTRLQDRPDSRPLSPRRAAGRTMTQTVSRAIDIIEICGLHPRTIRDLASELQVHRTTVLRTVQTLVDSGFLRKHDDNTYGPGFRLAVLAQATLRQFDLRTLVHPHIVALSDDLGYTVQFAIADGDAVRYVDKIEPVNAIVLNTVIGGEATVNTSGVAKAILANLPEEQRRRIIDAAPFARFTDATVIDRSVFLDVLHEVRQRGWAADRGEFDAASNCIAAPVFDHSGDVVGAISITSVRSVTNVETLLEDLPRLIRTTTEVSAELGYRPDDQQRDAHARA